MKIDKDFLRTEYTKVWKDGKMIDYCVNKVATYATLPDGKIVVVDKERIEKDFCFGESGYDYDDAQSMAAYARKSEDYFREQNMKHFEAWIKDLTEAMEENGDYKLVIHKGYTRQTPDCKIVSIRFYRLWEVIDACGGSVYLSELPGRSITIHGVEGKVATNEEIQLILDAYKEAAQAHEKKVNTYLKKYGTSKVHSWTYWRDA
jgi:hypothetical protein